MAESMCGPSNSLQNFHKHSGVDRTLQQDRLVSRQSPAQGFRSSPGPNAGLLDPEFEAFQAGNLYLDPSIRPNDFSLAHHPPQSFHQAGPSAWASDFQRMHISSPLPPFQQQPFVSQAQLRHDTGGWQQDFARQHSQPGEQSLGQIPSHTPSPFQYSRGMNIGSGFVGGLATPVSEALSQQQKEPAEIFDDEAFARAFDEAAQAEQMDVSQDSNQEQRPELGQDVMLDTTAERFMSEEADNGVLFNQERIGADAIHDPHSAEGREEQENPDALSRTAGQLLNSVQNNQSSKFQGSQFLNLMRQFRDKQAVVEGDKVISAGMENTELNTGMEGLSSEQEAMKEHLSSLLLELKKALLDRDRPYKANFDNDAQIGALLTTMQTYLKSLPRDTNMVRQFRIERTVTSAMDAYEAANPEAHSEVSLKLLAVLEAAAGNREDLDMHSQNGSAIALPMSLNVETFASGSK